MEVPAVLHYLVEFDDGLAVVGREKIESLKGKDHPLSEQEEATVMWCAKGKKVAKKYSATILRIGGEFCFCLVPLFIHFVKTVALLSCSQL